MSAKRPLFGLGELQELFACLRENKEPRGVCSLGDTIRNDP